MSPDTVWIISTVITVGVALAGFMYALVRGVKHGFGRDGRRPQANR